MLLLLILSGRGVEIVVVVLLFPASLALLAQVLVQVLDGLLASLKGLGGGFGNPLGHLGGDVGCGRAQKMELPEGVCTTTSSGGAIVGGREE